MERWGQINYSKIINAMTVQMTFHMCNSCYNSWDAFLFKVTVFWYYQLKKTSETSNRFEKNTVIQEESSKVHKVLLKLALCLKANKML